MLLPKATRKAVKIKEMFRPDITSDQADVAKRLARELSQRIESSKSRVKTFKTLTIFVGSQSEETPRLNITLPFCTLGVKEWRKTTGRR